ncbi:cAMP-binding domain of CRP or a regulatory subunit of cAMP-dependent protein kinases [Reichenbachiella faecimaris]|uniref:cAMP-binding domain of CRP or a regulatory subunit of cAMP-dependent protein kinases n=1 Tax=Reichenbachiella faecimaris TaxID=692418 RepID=A0A1W2G6E3_REIFA|nr:Crp/Fnr family transcriptional regulator [Reichenbachiella faecimaris]SMD32247.1 cAMP-binding domain of CRP or a regulatory subunit of cAMP-dependent protein kinases [Reichenbachiella faecimaris]
MSFRTFYNTVLNSSRDSNTDLPFPIKVVHFKKGEIVTKYDQLENLVYFINEGMVEMTIRSYVTEKIIDFFFENEMVCGFTSFLTQQPTDVQIKALIDCKMEMIKREDLMSAYKHSLEANQFGRILTEQGYIRKSNREKELLTKTAEEKYAEMFATHSQYISQIPVNKIAKYLGIHPESLSRIRKKLNS